VYFLLLLLEVVIFGYDDVVRERDAVTVATCFITAPVAVLTPAGCFLLLMRRPIDATAAVADDDDVAVCRYQYNALRECVETSCLLQPKRLPVCRGVLGASAPVCGMSYGTVTRWVC